MKHSARCKPGANTVNRVDPLPAGFSRRLGPLISALYALGAEVTEKKGSRSVVVLFHDVVAEMDLANDAWTAYLNRRTG